MSEVDARLRNQGHEGVPGAHGPRRSRRDGRRGGRGRGEELMVPPAEFKSYYGRPILKASPWTSDIPIYLYLGGLAGASSLLGAGADLTDRPSLRRASRLGALAGISGSFYFLVHDLGKPSRFHHMLRVLKPTSPMSVGTWILSAYGPAAGLAGAAELANFVPLPRTVKSILALLGRPAGLGAALVGPAVASYTAVLLADTATPTWHDSNGEMPYLFVGSAATAAAGLGLLAAHPDDAGPARTVAVVGAAVELAAEARMERVMGVSGEPMHQGTAGKLMRAGQVLAGVGALAALASRRSRIAAVVAGLSLMTGSLATRFGIFEAGQASARDPKYTVVPQRERLEQGD